MHIISNILMASDAVVPWDNAEACANDLLNAFGGSVPRDRADVSISRAEQGTTDPAAPPAVSGIRITTTLALSHADVPRYSPDQAADIALQSFFCDPATDSSVFSYSTQSFGQAGVGLT